MHSYVTIYCYVNSAFTKGTTSTKILVSENTHSWKNYVPPHLFGECFHESIPKTLCLETEVTGNYICTHF